MRSVAGDDYDGNVGDESGDRRVGDRIRREGNRRRIDGATAHAAVSFDFVAKITSKPVFFILRWGGKEEGGRGKEGEGGRGKEPPSANYQLDVSYIILLIGRSQPLHSAGRL